MLAASAALLAASAAVYDAKHDVIAEISSGYDPTTRPGLIDSVGNPHACPPAADVVQMEMAIKTVVELDQVALTYTLDGYLRLFWKDERLQFNSSACGLSSIALASPKTTAIQLWTPDVYFEQQVQTKLGSDAKGGESFFIYPDGSVFWSRQARFQLRCNMGFGRLPLDVQNCLVLAGLYSYTAENVRLEWKDAARPLGVVLDQLKGSPDKVVAGEWGITSIGGSSLIDSYPSGDYSYAKACIAFERRGSLNAYSFVFAIIFVALSYLGSWISATAAPGRIALAVICVLIVTNNYAAVKKELPPLGYSVFLMDFLFGCAMFNVAAFVVYALINFGLTVDAEITAIAKADTVIDIDGDGLLDWSEMRQAVQRLKTQPIKTAAKEASPVSLEVVLDSTDVPQDTSGGESQNYVAQFKTKRKSKLSGSWGICPAIMCIKPLGVRNWKYLDRYVRLATPVFFVLYVLVMFLTIEFRPTGIRDWGAVQSCPSH